MSFKVFVNRIVGKLEYYLIVVIPRRKFPEKEARSLSKVLKPKNLTLSQKHKLKSVWGGRLSGRDIRWYTIFNTLHPDIGDEIWRFVSPCYFVSYIDPWLVSEAGRAGVSDKNLTDLLLRSVRQPETVLRCSHGVYSDGSYRLLESEDAGRILSTSGELVIKPSVMSSGGSGVLFRDSSCDSVDKLMEHIGNGGSWLVQKKVLQSPVMARLNESSCNTVRILTILHDGQVHFLSSFFRFGAPGAKVDNVSSGGFYAGCSGSGVVGGKAYRLDGTHIDIGQFEIPSFGECVRIAKENAPIFADLAKIIAWDFAIDTDSAPVLVECNFGITDIVCIQMTNGPVLGDYVEWFLSHIPDTRFPDRTFYSDII